MMEVYQIAVILGIVICFLLFRAGIAVGRSQGRRTIIWEFQEIIDRMIGFAANEQYRELHMFLHDLVDGDFRLRSRVLEEKEQEEKPVAESDGITPTR